MSTARARVWRSVQGYPPGGWDGGWLRTSLHRHGYSPSAPRWTLARPTPGITIAYVHCAHVTVSPGNARRREMGRRTAFFAAFDTVSGDHAGRMVSALRGNGHLVCIQDRMQQWPCEPFGLTLSMHEKALGALRVRGDDDAWRQLTDAGEQMLVDLAEGCLHRRRGWRAASANWRNCWMHCGSVTCPASRWSGSHSS